MVVDSIGVVSCAALGPYVDPEKPKFYLSEIEAGRLLGSVAIMLVGFIISSAGVTSNAGCIFRSTILVGRLYARGFIFG